MMVIKMMETKRDRAHQKKRSGGTKGVATSKKNDERNASDIEEAAKEAGSTSIRGNSNSSNPVKWVDTTQLSHSQIVGFNSGVLEQAIREEPSQRTTAKNVWWLFSGSVRTQIFVAEGVCVDPKTVYKTKQRVDWDE